ncbi:MAG: Dabb family protein [Eubacteriales bacterium]|nr:Dabb family protein [Eubacteriales bacterium]
MIRYICLFKLNNPADADAVADKLHTMEGKIDGMLGMETGKNVWDNAARCYDLALTIDFVDYDAMIAYDTAPLHLECRDFIYPRRADGKTVVYEV